MLKLLFPCVSLIMLKNSKKSLPLTIISSLMILSIFPIMMSPDKHTMINSFLQLDLLPMSLISLTMWISFLMIMASLPTYIQADRSYSFTTLILSLMIILLFAFSFNNFFLFYIFFEASLIPTLLLILGWGYQPERLQAGVYLMLYTITASLPLLLLLAFLMANNNHLSFFLPMLAPNLYTWSPMMFSIIMTAAFMVKMPMYMTHLWLPKAHVEAPVAGSMILAGLLLKLGSYGLIRVLFAFPKISIYLNSMIMSISLIGATITSLICIRQTDMKALIAYSSVGHMALLVAGTMTMTKWGWQGSLLLMIAHGLCSSALFFLSYMTYTSSQSRSLFLTKGILSIFPALTLMWFMFSAFNMAAPPSINLASEIMLLTSALSFSFYSFLLLMFMSFLAAVYSLILYSLINHGYMSSQSNPMINNAYMNMLTALFHFLPLFMLIMSLNMISTWIMW